jgi:hypothetical protein
VLIKVVKLLGSLVPLEPRLAKKLTEPLVDIITTTNACVVAIIFIYVMDKISDLVKAIHAKKNRARAGSDWDASDISSYRSSVSLTNEAHIMESIIVVIKGTGIFIGFAWEQCFDVALESLSTVMVAPHVSKMLLAVGCAVIIVPAWRWWILPMVISEGWRFGFVIDPHHEVWDEVVKSDRFLVLKGILDVDEPLLDAKEQVASQIEAVLGTICDPPQGDDETIELVKRNTELNAVLKKALTVFPEEVEK